MVAKKTAPKVAKEGSAAARIAARMKASTLAGFLVGGEERDLAFIFSPVEGEEDAVLFGRLVRCEERVLDLTIGKPAKCLVFSPAIFQRKDEEAEPLISATTVLTTSLALRIVPEADVNGCFAIQYIGREKSDNPQFDAVRVYKVVQQKTERLRAALDSLGAVVLAGMLPSAQ